MKKTKTQKGITLIALIITIVVLLILAVVAINSITNDGIIDKAQDAASEYEIAQEKEKLQLDVLEWKLISNNGTPTLETHLKGIYGDENVQLNVDNSVTVTVPSGNKYIVKENGSVTLLDGTVEEPEATTISISLDKTEITKEITHGESVTETITATLNNASGTLTWLSSDPDVAELATSEGNTRTIEIKKAGTATITVTYAENTSIGAACTINVTEKDVGPTVANLKNTVLSTTKNTEVYDAYGNKIVVPAGFKIRVDSTTNNADTVTEGIVIEDGTNGNQFVWIPVGTIYTDTAQTPSLAQTITLGRYSFNSTTGAPSAYSGSFKEDTIASHNSNYKNVIARDIEAFRASTDPTTGNSGYYLGRYEARKNASGDLTTVTTDKVWHSVTQSTASSESQGMYADGYSSGTFSSDLINSYAWDTAIVFLQTFDNRADKTTPYSMQNSLNTGSVSTTGTTTDVICNIYDMASNCYEWSTETNIQTSSPCMLRGGSFNTTSYYASSRGGRSY